MAGRLSVDTSFLIDLQREQAAGVEGPARGWLRRDPEAEVHLSAVALGEFAEGVPDPDHPVLHIIRERHVLLTVDGETALTYGRIARTLRAQGRLIGSNDLWIAASSVRHGLPLVTADARAFSLVPGLEVVAYR